MPCVLLPCYCCRGRNPTLVNPNSAKDLEAFSSVRIIAFALFLDGDVPKAADRGAQTFDRLVPEVQGFRQSMFQDLALGIKRLLGWVAQVAFNQKSLAGVLVAVPLKTIVEIRF